MGCGLITHDVRHDPAARNLGVNVRRVRFEADREGAPGRDRGADLLERIIQILGLDVEVMIGKSPLEGPGVDVDHEGDPTEEGDGQRLRSPHLPKATRKHPAAGQILGMELQSAERREGFVRPLKDPLGSDVDPAAGSHLSVHREPAGFEVPEDVVGGPSGYQVGIGDEYPRCVRMGREDPDGLSRLDEEGLFGTERSEGGDDSIEGTPIACGLSSAPVHD